MTELTALPGLDTLERPQPVGERERWLERTPSPRLMLFSGRSNRGLAERIAEELGIELGAVELKTFANDEIYCRYLESIRGADVFIVQSGSPPVNNHLMELLIMIDGAEARVRLPDHRGHPLVPVLTPGQEVGAARTDLREARGRAPAVGRRRPGADDGSARRPDPGLLHASRRPHDRAESLRPVLPRRGLSGDGHRVGLPRSGSRKDGTAVRRAARGRAGDPEQDRARLTTSPRSPR